MRNPFSVLTAAMIVICMIFFVYFAFAGMPRMAILSATLMIINTIYLHFQTKK